ncbi:hypothetical protein ACJMK2_037231 [Sinanodonta woodiana]|uniref:Uncharacterized protein n=1 Tax=Sinanodonta woodiana TaxID=1069815 RepID=A0ABD3WJN6_SINWO
MKELLEFSNQNLGGNDIKEICDSLQNGELRIMSLRNCMLYDQDFKRVMDWVGQSRSLLQLSLNVGVIGDNFRVQLLAQALRKNRSLTTLFFAVASSGSNLRQLYVDYNQIGDTAVTCLLVGLVARNGLEVIDLEGAGITEENAHFLFSLSKSSFFFLFSSSFLSLLHWSLIFLTSSSNSCFINFSPLLSWSRLLLTLDKSVYNKMLFK